MLINVRFPKAHTLIMILSALLLLCAAVSCGNSEKDTPRDVSSADIVNSSEQPVDVSLSDTSMELGFGITRSIIATGGNKIEWKSSDSSIAAVENDGSVRGVDLGECVITARNEFGRSAECRVTVKKTCYLSIDDGPLSSAGFILDALKETDTKATFFLVDSIYFPIVKRMADEGHALALHTRFNRTSRCYSNQYIYYTDLEIMNDHLEEITGQRSNILRFPGGSNNETADHLTMRRIVNGAHDLGYRVFDWTMSAGDASSKGTYELSCKMIYTYCTKNQEIILMHDKNFTPNVIRTMVPILRKRGYVFETLDHYPDYSYEFVCAYSRDNPDIPAESVVLNPPELEIPTGSEFTLEAVMTPEESTDFVVWESSDDSVAKTDMGGTITGIAVGEAVITAKTTSGKTATCKIKVIPKQETSSGEK